MAALALDADPKWVDNVLSHHNVPGVERRRQGMERKIPAESLLVLAIAQALIQQLALPIGKALDYAAQLRSAENSTVKIADVTLRADISAISVRLHERLADAVEGAARRPRGRPAREG